MAQDAQAAVCTSRGERMDGALERIERMRMTGLYDLKRLVVRITARFALSFAHVDPPSTPGCSGRAKPWRARPSRSCELPLCARSVLSQLLQPRADLSIRGH